MTYPVIGPLWQPTSPSGVHFPTCTHQPPASCPKCNGEQAERLWRAERDRNQAVPPCMRTEEVS